MDYFSKYLKYKLKYLNLANLQIGGDKPFIKDIYKINLFKNSEMEMYLNPIYGLIYCNIGFIPNNYYLKDNDILNIDISNVIKQISNKIIGEIIPTKDILKYIKPIDFGRYIATKYVFFYLNKSTEEKILKLTNKGDIIHNNNKIEENEKIKEFIKKKSIRILKTKIPIDSKPEIEYFHIILYCLWWTLGDDNGIKEYYNGIKEVFEIIFKNCLKISKEYECKIKKSLKYLDIKNEFEKYACIFKKENIFKSDTEICHAKEFENSFEKVIYKILSSEFHIYEMSWSKHFCLSSKDNTYPDCGETVLRNLINLSCFNGIKFDIDELIEFNPIEQLREYYKYFNNFEKQSNKKEICIYSH